MEEEDLSQRKANRKAKKMAKKERDRAKREVERVKKESEKQEIDKATRERETKGTDIANKKTDMATQEREKKANEIANKRNCKALAELFKELRASNDTGEGGDSKKIYVPSAVLKSDVAQLSTSKVEQSTHTSHTTHIEQPIPDTKGVYLLTFDGYYTENNSQGENGGYGAMLRCRDGTPVAAVAGGSTLHISEYFHTLEGLQHGLDLTISQGIKSVHCVCSSKRVCETLMECFISNSDGECPYHPGDLSDMVCQPCLQSNLVNNEPFELVLNMVRDIVRKGQQYYRSLEGLVDCHIKEWNKPAHYLAKLERSPGIELKLAPEEFPKDLQDLVNQYEGRNPFIYN